MHVQSVISGTAFCSSVRKTNQKRKEPENSGAGAEENKTKSKPKPKELKEITFPYEGFVNKYNFMRVSDAILAKLGWKITGDRLAVELDLKDGALVVRKPSK